MSNEVEQIKERLNVAEVVGEYLRLEKAGSNYKGLCPFHSEKTPSFMVNPERNFWYCFGCQKGGDIFSFVQEMEGVEFRDALERLAERAGVELPKYSPEAKKEKSKKQKVFEILECATKFYQHQLKNSNKGKQMVKYLAGRNIDGKLIDIFRLGYSPDGWTNIMDYLINKGYSKNDIVETGLLVRRDDKTYDRFRNRIMFPILGVTGDVVGYSARVAPGGDESSAKYINTPQTIVYDKSRILYGLYQSRTAIRKVDQVIVVEGNTDVIASHKAGLSFAVAVSGTALTDEHLKIMGRYSKNVKLCFDMDEAGQRATKRSIQSSLQSGMDVEIVILPTGEKDVSDLVRKDPAAWQKVASASIPIMDYYFDTILKKYNPENIKEKKKIASELLNVIKHIADPIEKNYYLKKLSARISVDENILTNILSQVELKKDIAGSVHQTKDNNERVSSRVVSRKEILEERLLGLLVLFPDQLMVRAKKIKKDYFSIKNRDILDSVLEGRVKNFQDEINEMMAKVKYSYDSKVGFIENNVDPTGEWDLVSDEIESENDGILINKLILDIKKAEAEGDEKKLEELMEQLAEKTKESD